MRCVGRVAERVHVVGAPSGSQTAAVIACRAGSGASREVPMHGRGFALILCVLLCAEAGAAPPAAGETDAKAALAKLRALAGEWQGTFEWTGARQDKG